MKFNKKYKISFSLLFELEKSLLVMYIAPGIFLLTTGGYTNA
jgi:hypothetical protein